MLVLNRKPSQTIAIGQNLKTPSDNPEIMIRVTSVSVDCASLDVARDQNHTKHTLKVEEPLKLNDSVMVQLSSINYNEVKLAFDAPINYRILRGEL